MATERAMIIFNVQDRKKSYDLDVPLDISANDLVVALNSVYELNIDVSDIKKCYLKSENPIALLRGNKPLSDYGIRNGSVINFTE